jgi:MoxR-like ATPase
MAFDFATFLNTIPAILDARLPVLIRGRHGVGKSEVVYMIAGQRSLPVVERRASQMTEGDLLGLPDTADLSDGRKATTWNAPDWLVTACTEPVVLFLDEVG